MKVFLLIANSFHFIVPSKRYNNDDDNNEFIYSWCDNINSFPLREEQLIKTNYLNVN